MQKMYDPCRDPGSISDLQSDALPTELSLSRLVATGYYLLGLDVSGFPMKMFTQNNIQETSTCDKNIPCRGPGSNPGTFRSSA